MSCTIGFALAALVFVLYTSLLPGTLEVLRQGGSVTNHRS